MERNYINLTAAAKQLEVSVSSIKAYVKKGYLRAGTKKNEVVLEDVLALKREREEAPPFDKTTFAKLCRQVKRMEAELRVMKMMLNLRVEPLIHTDAEWYAFYRMAQTHGNEGAPSEFQQTWADLLIRIQPQDLDKLEEITKNPDPWRPFLYLACQLSDHGSEHMRAAFKSCENYLRGLASVWLASKDRQVGVFDSLSKLQQERIVDLIK